MPEVVLQDLMSICVDGPSLEDFDATESINVWLMEGTGTRHLDGHQPKRTSSVSAVDCASINACTIGNCLRLYCRWSYMMSI